MCCKLEGREICRTHPLYHTEDTVRHPILYFELLAKPSLMRKNHRQLVGAGTYPLACLELQRWPLVQLRYFTRSTHSAFCTVSQQRSVCISTLRCNICTETLSTAWPFSFVYCSQLMLVLTPCTSLSTTVSSSLLCSGVCCTGWVFCRKRILTLLNLTILQSH